MPIIGDRQKLLALVKDILKQADFSISVECRVKSSCFDIAARKGSLLALIKVLINIDALSANHARELKYISYLLSASPLLIGERAGKEPMEEGVVYERYGIPAINPFTLYNILIRSLLPVIYAKRGGFFVKLNTEKIRACREKKGYSLGVLADLVGVSRKSIYEYERGEMDASLETALRLEEVLEEDITLPIDVFSWNITDVTIEDVEFSYIKDILKEKVFRLFQSLGFKTFPTRCAPFDAITEAPTQEEAIFLTGVGYADDRTILRRIRIVKSVSKVVQKDAVFIIEGKKVSNSIEGVPILRTNELKRMEDPEDLINIISRRCKYEEFNHS
ncbi:MAG: transcriptional regulator [Candidatus Baldrarchaeia archaeon]